MCNGDGLRESERVRPVLAPRAREQMRDVRNLLDRAPPDACGVAHAASGNLSPEAVSQGKVLKKRNVCQGFPKLRQFRG